MGALNSILMAAVFAGGMAAGIGGFALWDQVIDDPAVRRAARLEGAQTERLAWQEARNRAEILAAQKLAAMQAEIDAAERALSDWQINDRRRVDAFRKTLEEQKRDDDQAGTDRSACALPDRMWNGLR